MTDPGRTPADEQALDVAVQHRLHAELVAWTARFPEVPIQVSVVHGNPAQALLRAAEGCRLVVLGTRGDGAYTRDLFGSTSREVLRRSPVTVLVVNPDTVGTEPDPENSLLPVRTTPSSTTHTTTACCSDRPETDHDHAGRTGPAVLLTGTGGSRRRGPASNACTSSPPS